MFGGRGAYRDVFKACFDRVRPSPGRTHCPLTGSSRPKQTRQADKEKKRTTIKPRWRVDTVKTLGRRDAAVERTGMYSKRVLTVSARHLGGPTDPTYRQPSSQINRQNEATLDRCPSAHSPTSARSTPSKTPRPPEWQARPNDARSRRPLAVRRPAHRPRLFQRSSTRFHRRLMSVLRSAFTWRFVGSFPAPNESSRAQPN